MRILQVASALQDWGGIERYVLYLCDGLSARGHRVHASVPKASPLDTRLRCRKHPITLKRQFSPLTLTPYLRLFKKIHYDVVHTHFSPDFVMPALAARLTRQPYVIMTRHVALPWKPSQVRRYTKLYDHIICVSDATKRHLIESKVPDRMLTVAKAGCPSLRPEKLREPVRAMMGIARGDFAIGVFGRLVKEKGVETMIAAHAHLPANVRIEIFGQGPQREELELLAAQAGAERVRFHGFVEGIDDCMNAMDCVAIPSTWEEAFPFAALEALSLGKPLIVSNVGGLPELVQHKRTGLLFEKGNAEELAKCVRHLQEIPNLKEAIQDAAKRAHRSDYTVDAMASRIEEVYTSRPGARRR
ncbi:MAG TPA: glycosyltransferase family 4 protein [Fimbriimonadaceae bacterium]|nr:glycosyltransferase family 4 protein [Fimbriimonadaceae bacterium]